MNLSKAKESFSQTGYIKATTLCASGKTYENYSTTKYRNNQIIK